MTDREKYYDNLIDSSKRYTESHSDYQEYIKIRQISMRPPVVHPWPPEHELQGKYVQNYIDSKRFKKTSFHQGN